MYSDIWCNRLYSLYVHCSERKHCLHPRIDLLRGAIYEKTMSRIVLLTWVGKQCSCVVIVSLYIKGAWKKILWKTRVFCICMKLFKLICNFFRNWLYVKYQLSNLYVAVNYFEGQLLFLTRGNPKYDWSLDGREASWAKYRPLPTPSSDTWWGSFVALDGHLLG